MKASLNKGSGVYHVLNLIRKPIRPLIIACLVGGLVTFALGQVSGYAGLGIIVPTGTAPTGDFAGNYGKSSGGLIGKVGLDVLIIDQIGLALSAMSGINSNHYQYSHLDLEADVWLRHYGIFGGILVALNKNKIKIRIMPGYGKTTSSKLTSWFDGSTLLPKDSAGSFGFDIGASYEFNIIDKIGFFIGFDFLHWKAEFEKLEHNILNIDVQGPASLLSLTGGIVF